MPKTNLETKETLNIYSLEQLSRLLDISLAEIEDVSSNMNKHYKKDIRIFKRNGKDKERVIYSVFIRLERILSAIDSKLLKKIKLPDSMHGSRRGHSNKTNAEVHLRPLHLLKLDIGNFFPSIRPKQVYDVFFNRLKCSGEVATVLKKLLTTDGHVPQGYNTSPSIANLVLVPAVSRIEGFCKIKGYKATIYVDDITISGYNNPKDDLKMFEKILNEYGFNIKKEKIVYSNNRGKQEVTGVIVNKKLNLDRDQIKALRSHIHIIRKYGPEALIEKGVSNSKGEEIHDSIKLKNCITGSLNYVKSINPERANRLKRDCDCIEW